MLLIGDPPAGIEKSVPHYGDLVFRFSIGDLAFWIGDLAFSIGDTNYPQSETLVCIDKSNMEISLFRLFVIYCGLKTLRR